MGTVRYEVGTLGVLPMENSTAKVSRVKLSASQTIVPVCGSS